MAKILICLLFSSLGFASYYQRTEFLPVAPPNVLSKESIEKLTPQSSSVLNLFSDLIDHSALLETRSAPGEHVGFGEISDSANMLGLSIQMSREAIAKHSLIILDSGHSLPVASYMMRKYFDKFTIQTVLHLPSELNLRPSVRKRLIAQSRAWGSEMASLQKSHAKKGPVDIVILALEAHRKEGGSDYVTRLPLNLLPTTQELKDFGIRQVILMTEAHPDASDETIFRYLRDDTKAYLESLKLPILYLGNDCRRENLCWDIIGEEAPHGKFGIF